MPMYLGRFSYTPEALKALIDNPHDRAEVAAKTIESLGGKLHGFWYAFGEYDGYFLMEVPDNATAVAASVTAGSSGTLSKHETVPLMSVEEGIEAFRKAQSASFTSPQG